MRSAILIAGLAALATASPTPQIFDSDQLADLPSPPITDVSSGAGSEIIPLDTNALAANAVSDIIADPSPDLDTNLPAAVDTSTLEKRTPGDCAVQPVGYGPTITPDSPDAFLSSTLLSGPAIAAPKWVNGFHQTFQNKQASVSGCSYQGYKTYKTYDVSQAAADCKSIAGCKGFNIFFERDPTKDPGANCPNPWSTTVVKASFWGNLIGENLATNKGQYRDQFQVVIAGSNGYNIDSCETAIQGWTQQQLGSCTINSPPSTCANGKDSYLTYQSFSDGNMDNKRCKAACDALTARDPSTPCNFFTSYMQVHDNKCGVQFCVFYQRAWDKSYCTNTGDPVNLNTIAWASSFTNNACDGSELCPAPSTHP